MNPLDLIPFLGAGVSYRDAWRWEVVRHRDELGLVECIPDDVAGAVVGALGDGALAVGALRHAHLREAAVRAHR